LERANGRYVLGLFADDNIPFVLDRGPNTPSLLNMTKKAIAIGTNYGKSVNETAILRINRSVSFMAKEIKEGLPIKEVVEKYAGIKLSDKEVKMIEERAKEDPKYGLVDALGEIISKKVGIIFASHKHTGDPVPLMAYGPGAENFRGFMHHIDTSRTIAKLMLFGSWKPLLRR